MSSGSTVPAGGRAVAWRPLQRSTRLAIFVALLATFAYLLFLLRPENRGGWLLWILTLTAEGVVAFHALGTWWTILAHDDQPEDPGVAMRRNDLRVGSARPPTIDVFVTACGEDDALVLRTARAARDLQLHHRTFVLDDGRSDVLQERCLAEGIGYLRRPDRDHAKAGNVNAALARTDGEFVVVLDADHVPDPDLLLELLPAFVDADVAFVQSPQFSTNSDNLIAVGAAEAQRIFYELVCPGKNHFNAAFCVGTNVMFRRAALDEVDGIHIGSNSEDIWTSIDLHERGWRSVYTPRVLARGLAPDDIGAFFKQQFRWASGGFEVLLRGPVFRRGRGGLTLDQRLQYLFVGTHYLTSLAMLVFMLLPATYLMFGRMPLQVDGLTWAAHYVPFFASTMLVTWLQSGGFRPAAIVTSIGAAPVHLKAFLAVLFRRRATWSVTNATAHGAAGLWPVMAHIGLLVFNVTAIAVGLTVMQEVSTTWLATGFAAMHVLVLGRLVAEAVRGGSARGPATPAPTTTPSTSPSTTPEPTIAVARGAEASP